MPRPARNHNSAGRKRRGRAASSCPFSPAAPARRNGVTSAGTAGIWRGEAGGWLPLRVPGAAAAPAPGPGPRPGAARPGPAMPAAMSPAAPAAQEALEAAGRIIDRQIQDDRCYPDLSELLAVPAPGEGPRGARRGPGVGRARGWLRGQLRAAGPQGALHGGLRRAAPKRCRFLGALRHV